MIEHTYQVLEYHLLLETLSHYASCPVGQSNCLSLKPSNDAKFIDNELRLVSEMRLLLKVKGFLSFSGLTEILPYLRKSSVEGSCLEPDKLLRILRLVESCQKSKKLIRSNLSLCPRTYDLVRDMPGCEALVKTLKDTISLEGAVRDSASPALKKVREKKIRLRSDLQKKLRNIQESKGLHGDRQDHLVTVRDGRYVIALRTDKKSQIQGIIHDYSQTRATCFLEPIEVIQDNNRLAELIQAEKAEEFRILARLTGMIRDSAAELEYLEGLIGRLDGLCARARFSETLSCVAAEVGEKDSVELKGARNPILLAMALDNKGHDERVDPPVPVDILVDARQNVLIISGPNRGGKTVTLKTLGLMSLMTQAGIHIPAEEGSCLPVFDKIMADIGDDQDIQAGLSTFSAHAANLRYFVENTNQKSLVIIDEPGMGTDPDEGVALAMAIMDFLCRQGAFLVVSTHSNRLKTYALLNERAVSASVEFDIEKECPTFRLNYGSPGTSHALEIARDMGVPISILDRARGYLDQDEIHLNRLIEKLNCLTVEADREKRDAEEARKRHDTAARKIEERLTALEADKRAVIEAKRVEAEAAIKEAREELKKAINLLKDKKEPAQALVTEKYTEISRKVMDCFLLDNNDRPASGLEEIKKGQLVYHRRLKQKGIVQSVDPSGERAMVILGKVKTSAEIQDLEVVREAQEPGLDQSAGPVFWDVQGTPPKELNVIGYRVDEAIPLIERTIDRSLVEGEMTLRIIHGFGTGRLREAIRAHLKGIASVKRICSADPRFGGDAITVVELC